MTQGHNSNIEINVFLDAASTARRGFGLILLLVALSTNSLDDERVVEYASLADAQAAEDAGFISAATLAIIEDIFAQPSPPDSILVGYRDDGSDPAETWAAAIAAIRAIRDDFYVVVSTTKTDVAIAAIAAVVEGITPAKRIYIAQSNNADWLTSGVPSGFSSIVAYERTAVIWHSTDAQGADAAWASNRVAFDPEEISTPWHAAPLANIASYTTALTDSQRSLAIANNCNVLAAWGSYSNVTDPGVNISGRPIDELVSADWLEARLREDISDLVVKQSSRGRKIGVDIRGQAQVQAVIEARLQQGVAVGHFAQGQAICTALAISTADTDNRRLRFDVAAQLLGSMRKATVNVYLGREPVVVEA